MAKINLKDISPVKSLPALEVTFNDNLILVEQYLPVNKKVALVEKILNETVDDSGFFSPTRLKVYYTIEMLRTYTNISITDKMMESPEKVYDMICLNHIDKILDEVPQEETDSMWENITKCAAAISTYQNSLVGMMKTITKDYDSTKINVEELMQTLDQPDKVGLVKEILEKIG